MSHVQSRIASQVREAKAHGRRPHDPWGQDNGILVLESRNLSLSGDRPGTEPLSGSSNKQIVLVPGAAESEESPVKKAAQSFNIPFQDFNIPFQDFNIPFADAADRSERSIKEEPSHHVKGSVNQSSPSELTSIARMNKKSGEFVPVEEGETGKMKTKVGKNVPPRKPRSPIRKQRQDKKKDAWDFEFQLLLPEDMSHLIESTGTSGESVMWHDEQRHEAPNSNEKQHRSPPVDDEAFENPVSVTPAPSASMRRASPEQLGLSRGADGEPLTSKIELLREVCEDSLGMDLFHTAYSALRDHPNRESLRCNGAVKSVGGVLGNREVIEFIPDLLTLLRCEDIVYA